MGESVNLFRSVLTVLGFLCFLGIVVWAYSKSPKARFDEAAQLPFADEKQHEESSLAQLNEVGTRSGSKK